MTFKYSVTLPISGGNKLRRFREWAERQLPNLSYSLPQQTPIETTAMTVRLLSLDDRARVLNSWATTPPPGPEGLMNAGSALLPILQWRATARRPQMSVVPRPVAALAAAGARGTVRAGTA